jgi:hypothetical protein
MGIMMENNFETMELAVKEQAEELARVNEEIRNITAVVKVLADKIDSFADKLGTQNITVHTDTRPVQKMLDGYLSNMNVVAERALNKMRTNVWQLYFQTNGPKWTVILISIITFMVLTYRLFASWLEK